MSIYQQGLGRNPANHQPLTPIGFLQRAAEVHPDKLAIVHGDRRINYAEYWRNARRLASALTQQGIGVGSTVSIMCANIPEFLEAHFGVPMTGAVLNALNTRLDAAGLAFILDHSECDLLFTDSAYSAVVKKALSMCERSPRVIDIVDPLMDGGELLGEMTYEAFVAQGDAEFAYEPPADEWQALTLNYTSGTTGNPKGVVYSHRGAYLNCLGNLVTWPMSTNSVYLWTLPMFHCNGWCFPWSVVAAAATHVCLRQVEVGAIARLMNDHGVTHMCGAPIVLNTILTAPDELREQIPPGVKALTAGAPPPPAVIEGIEAMGFEITQVYGLTEVYGPCVVSEWKEQWDQESSEQRAALKARQGVRYLTQESVDVLDPETLEPVPADGETIGEIMFRGNTTMKGYLKVTGQSGPLLLRQRQI